MICDFYSRIWINYCLVLYYFFSDYKTKDRIVLLKHNSSITYATLPCSYFIIFCKLQYSTKNIFEYQNDANQNEKC